jgi:hypothetical protein
MSLFPMFHGALTIHFSTFLVALNHFNDRITVAAPKLGTVAPNWTYNLLV